MVQELDNRKNSLKRVAVLGGGLAGLAAACRLLEHGFHVTVFEQRPFFGGRVYSFNHGPEDLEVDNGQHVFLGCCTQYINFLKTIGSLNLVNLPTNLRTEIVLNGNKSILRGFPILGMMHLFPSFIMYKHLGFVDKLLLAYGLLQVKLVNRSKGSSRLEYESFYDWLKRHKQTDRAIENFWNLFILPSLNDEVRNVSADAGLMVVQEGMLNGPSDAAIGLSKVGLRTLNGDPARVYLESRGAILGVGKAIKEINVDSDRICGITLSNGESIDFDAYISALPSNVLLDVLPNDMDCWDFFSPASELQSSPIIGVHLWYDRPVMEQEFVAFLNSPIQWVFNKSLIQQSYVGEGQYVCISVSGAHSYVNISKEELTKTFVEEMSKLFPVARKARINKVLVVKERNATFRPIPGANKNRLPQITPLTNLFLAGEWTRTGWPSTMEGAVISGILAANATAEGVQKF